MRAYVEWLDKQAGIGIVRAGPHCYRFKQPYEYAAVVQRMKFKGRNCEVKSLVADGKFKTAHKQAMLGKLLLYFDRVNWLRFKNLTTPGVVVWCRKSGRS